STVAPPPACSVGATSRSMISGSATLALDISFLSSLAGRCSRSAGSSYVCGSERHLRWADAAPQLPANADRGPLTQNLVGPLRPERQLPGIELPSAPAFSPSARCVAGRGRSAEGSPGSVDLR